MCASAFSSDFHKIAHFDNLVLHFLRYFGFNKGEDTQHLHLFHLLVLKDVNFLIRRERAGSFR